MTDRQQITYYVTCTADSDTAWETAQGILYAAVDYTRRAVAERVPLARDIVVMTAEGHLAAAYRQAADEAHAEGNRLYDDMGRTAAEGAWSVRDLLRRRADEIEQAPADNHGDTR